MDQKLEATAKSMIRRARRRKIWTRFLSVIMCLVVFCTTYALILPAITKETGVYCGHDAHTHEDKCYEKVLICEANEGVHTHGDSCFAVEQTLICDMTESEGHTHSDACSGTEKVLSCGQEESLGHSHSDECTVTERILSCGMEESEGHTHGPECSTSTLTCTLPEDETHSHSEECYSNTLTCTLAESTGHAHSDSCYTETTTYICGLEESQGHAHSDDCYTETSVNICGLEETQPHTHSESCYQETKTLICPLEEAAEHTHTDACYENKLICSKEEHEHTKACYSNPNADTESASTWEATLPEQLTGEYAVDVMMVAESQLGYHESTANYAVMEDGSTKGYTRYGAWYGIPYGDWCAMFVSFCLEYAGVTDYPLDCNCQNWIRTLEKLDENAYEAMLDAYKASPEYDETLMSEFPGLDEYDQYYAKSGNYQPVPGDIIFFEWDGDGVSDHVGFVKEYIPATEHTTAQVKTLEGNSSNKVQHVTYELSDSRIMGYGRLPSQTFYCQLPGHIHNGCSDCGIAEHEVHLDCWDCGYTEHIHTEECLIPVEETPVAPEESEEIEMPESSEGSELPEGSDIPADPIIPEGVNAWVELTAYSEEAENVNYPAEEAAEDVIRIEAAQAEQNAVQLFAFRAASPFVMPRNTSLDLTDWINDVEIFKYVDGEQVPVTNGATVTEGDLLQIRLEYTIPGQKLGTMGENEAVNVTSNTVTYSINSLQPINSDSGNIYDSSKNIVGTFVIDGESKTITLTYSDDYVKENATGKQIHGYISFFSVVTKTESGDNEQSDYIFKDSVSVDLVVQERVEAEGDLSVEKAVMHVDGNEISYMITINSAAGTNGAVTLTDTMSNGLTVLDGIEVRKADGTPVDASFTPGEGNSSFTMTLPEMAAGEIYIIRYRCTADLDLLGADMTVHNTVSVTGKDSQDNELKDETTVDYTFEVLRKTGINNNDGTITWTITVNQAKADISNWKLKDVIITSKGEASYTGTVTIKNANGTVVGENVSLPYTFPEGSKDTYVITYTTTHDYGDGDMVTNKAILQSNNTDVTVLSGIAIGTPVQKSGTAGEIFQNENGQYILPITWTVTIDTTNGEIPANKVLQDTLEDWNNNEMYMTYDQLMAAYENIRAALSSVGSAASEFKAMEYRAGMGHNSDKEYNYSDLIGNVDGTHEKLYDYFEVTLGEAIPKGKHLTFTYEAYGLFENNVIAGSIYTNQFDISGQYQVKGIVEFTSGAIKAKKMALNYYDPVAHKDQFWLWNLYDYNGTEGITKLAYEKLIDGYLAWTIELSAPPDYWGTGDIVLYEDLPEGVSVKGLTLPFKDNIPTLPSQQPPQLWDIEPGKTYQWDLNLYKAEQYLNWSFWDGQPVSVSIVIEVSEDGDLKITIPGVVFETMAQYTVLLNERNKGVEGYPLEEWYAYLHVFTQIDEDFAWTPQAEGSLVYVNAFENRFSLVNENGDVIDVGSQTQEVKKDDSKGIVVKRAETDADNIFYSVLLNPKALDLDKESGKLKVKDTLTYTSTDDQMLRAELVGGTVKLYEYAGINEDGSFIKGEEVDFTYLYHKTNSIDGAGVTTWTHTLDLTVPDGKALVLEYRYWADGDLNVNHELLNTCSIEGGGSSTLEGDNKVDIEIKQASAGADVNGISIYKVDAEDHGQYLEGAKFNLYIWNADRKEYIIVSHPDNGGTTFVTDKNGLIFLDESTMAEEFIAFNTAYYLEEIESPEGYCLNSKPYYFYVEHEDTEAYPSCLPDNFQGVKHTDGDTIFIANEDKLTEITVRKKWQDHNYNEITITGDEVESITFAVWQKQYGADDSEAVKYGEYTISPDENGFWEYTVTDLPDAYYKEDGTRDFSYVYFIKEVSVPGYEVTYEYDDGNEETTEDASGIAAGTVIMTNRLEFGFELPETGGVGTTAYTTGGLLLMATAVSIYLLYRFKKHRRRGFSSS